MIDLFRAYMDTFPDSSIRVGNDDVSFIIEDDDGADYLAYDGNDAAFLDRLERSKKCGRNLFLTECEKLQPTALPRGAIPD